MSSALASLKNISFVSISKHRTANLMFHIIGSITMCIIRRTRLCKQKVLFQYLLSFFQIHIWTNLISCKRSPNKTASTSTHDNEMVAIVYSFTFYHPYHLYLKFTHSNNLIFVLNILRNLCELHLSKMSHGQPVEYTWLIWLKLWSCAFFLSDV